MNLLRHTAQSQRGKYLINYLVSFILALTNTNIYHSLLSDPNHLQTSDPLSNDLNTLYKSIYRASRHQIRSMLNTYFQCRKRTKKLQRVDCQYPVVFTSIKLGELQFLAKSSWVRAIGLYRKLAEENAIATFVPAFVKERYSMSIFLFLVMTPTC